MHRPITRTIVPQNGCLQVEMTTTSRELNRRGTLVAIHGWTRDHTDWRAMTPIVHTGHDLMAVDLKEPDASILPNGSRHSKQRNYFERAALDVAHTLKHNGIETPHLVLHSMGGLVGLAYLRLVGSYDGLDALRPKSVTFVTPVLDDPRKTLPDFRAGFVKMLGSAYARYQITRAMKRLSGMQADEATRVMNVGRADKIIIDTLETFGFGAPIIFGLYGAHSSAATHFVDFVLAASTTEGESRLMGVYAMSTEGPELAKDFANGQMYAPERAFVVGGMHDLFVDHRKVAKRVVDGFKTAKIEIQFSVMEGTGHFPFLEMPGKFNGRLRNFLCTN